jgi:Zn-dependent peptidase ImmA (M78 family)
MIKDLAKRTLLSKGGGKVPVDLEMIAFLEGIEVLRSPCFTNDGEAYIENGRRKIKINATNVHSRQRFTLAHELAHHILGHTQGGTYFRDSGYVPGSDPKEIEANLFAANLLVPEELLINAIETGKAGSIADLAGMFDVSGAVIEYRLKDLGYI